MAELKDFGAVKTWYETYKSVQEAEMKKPEDKEKEDKKKSPVEVLPKDGGDEEQEENKEQKPEQSGEVEKLKAEIEKLKGELQKKDLEVKKKDAETTVEPNPDTGEIPLRVGIAQSILDKKKKAEKKNGKDVKEEVLDESMSKVTKKRASNGDIEVFYRGRTKYGMNKQIGYYHKEGSYLSVYHDNEDDKDDFTQNDQARNERDAIKMIYNTAKSNRVIREQNEEVTEQFTSMQIDRLKKEFSKINVISTSKANALSKHLDGPSYGKGELEQLVKADIKFVSPVAVNKLIGKHGYNAMKINRLRTKR